MQHSCLTAYQCSQTLLGLMHALSGVYHTLSLTVNEVYVAISIVKCYLIDSVLVHAILLDHFMDNLPFSMIAGQNETVKVRL